jgi:cell division septal protein FtsQ
MLKKHRYYKPKRKIHQTRNSRAENEEREVNTSVIKKIVGLIFFVAAFFWFIYFFLFSDNFIIKSIVIEGNENIPLNELHEIVDNHLGQKKFFILSNRNILVASVGGISAATREQYIVDEIEIKRILPFTLSISLKEKLARVVLRTKTPIEIILEEPEEAEEQEDTGEVAGDQVSHNNVTIEDQEPERKVEYTNKEYYLDVNGIIVSDSVSITDLATLPVIEIFTSSESEIILGQELMDRETIELIFSLYELVRGSQESILVSHVIYDPLVPKELKFETTEGWQAFLSTQIALETQIKKLELALQEKIKDSRNTLQYVDLRIKDRVYFK